MRTRWSSTFALATLWLGGCGPSPAEVVEAAQEAAELGELSPMLQSFTQSSATLIRNLHEVASQSRGEVMYLDPLIRILPRGTVTQVEETDDRAVVTVEDDRQGVMTIPLVREGGDWRIDGLSLPGFWRPIGGAR